MQSEYFKNHFFDYLVLIIILLGGFFFFSLFNYSRIIQVEIVVLVAILYVIWGIVHHRFFENNLDLKIIVEYFLIAVLSSAALILLLLRT